MPITTTVDNSNTIAYTANMNLTQIAKEHSTTAARLLVNADRANDSLEGTLDPLAVGDVIILNGSPKNSAGTPPVSQREGFEVTEEKVAGAVVGGASGVFGGAALGAKIGSIGGPWGMVLGGIIGAGIGWMIGDACD